MKLRQYLCWIDGGHEDILDDCTSDGRAKWTCSDCGREKDGYV